MTNESQKQEIKELADELEKARDEWASENHGVGQTFTEFVAKRLIASGYRNINNIKLTKTKEVVVADLSKIERKHGFTFGEVLRDIENTFGIAGNGLKYSQFILDCIDVERETGKQAQLAHNLKELKGEK